MARHGRSAARGFALLAFAVVTASCGANGEILPPVAPETSGASAPGEAAQAERPSAAAPAPTSAALEDPFSLSSVVVDGETYEIRKLLSKDAISAIFAPTFLTPAEAELQYRDDDLVIGVSIGGERRAYNVAYLSGHEIVNDVVGGKPIAVTW